MPALLLLLEETVHASDVNPLWIIPFAILLLSIAVAPFINKHWWEHNYPYVAVGLGLPVVGYYLFGLHNGARMLHVAEEYISFIALIGSLFVVTGGILIRLQYRGKPLVNGILLLFGGIIANLIGTTGASALLIRPFLRINKGRLQPYHIVLFIFAVSNVGGLLTPIGDPPLFLGYLKGVPFFWTTENLWLEWLIGLGVVLTVFLVLDSRNKAVAEPGALRTGGRTSIEGPVSGSGRFDSAEAAVREARREAEEADQRAERLPGGKGHRGRLREEVNEAVDAPRRASQLTPDEAHAQVEADIARGGVKSIEVLGLRNLIFLTIIIAATLYIPKIGALPAAAIQTAAAAAAYFTSQKEVLTENEFNFGPIKEVGLLFIGIFATMVPALDYLELHAADLGFNTPGLFYWGSGVLSAVLDNAPTYLNFLSAAVGLFVNDQTVELVRQIVSQPNTAEIIRSGLFHGQHLTPEVVQTAETLLKYHAGLVATGHVPTDDIQICYLLGNHNIFIKAVSTGSVFFGAMTYIGNGPNFMVKSISEQAGGPAPSFFGYILRYSIPILLPTYTLIWWLFFSHGG